MALTVFFSLFQGLLRSLFALSLVCPSICRLSQACDFVVGIFSPQNSFQISRCKPSRTDPLLACYVLLRFEEVGPSPKTIFAKSVWDTRLSPVFSTFLVGHSPLAPPPKYNVGHSGIILYTQHCLGGCVETQCPRKKTKIVLGEGRTSSNCVDKFVLNSSEETSYGAEVVVDHGGIECRELWDSSAFVLATR